MQTLLARLKAATRVQHLQLERDLDILGEGITRTDHHRVLRRFYGFYDPWEERAVPVLERGHPGLTAGRSKLALLRRDLENLGDSATDVEALPRCSALPELASLPPALGSMYVLEGATLGGQVVCRHLARTLGIEAGGGAAFYHSYGAEVGVMWRRFGEALSSHEGEAEEVMVESARETFRLLRTWLAPGPRDTV